MHKIYFNLNFKINSKVFSFTLNFINKSCRVWNLDSNKIGLTIFAISYNFLRISQGSNMVHMTKTHGFTWGPRTLALRPLEQNKVSQICPCRRSMVPGIHVSCVLAGGEVRGGDGPVPHDLQRLLIKMGGDVLKGH
jgi:hypothetical protein